MSDEVEDGDGNVAAKKHGYMTVVFRYENFDQFRDTLLLHQIFELAKLGSDGRVYPHESVVVTGISHDDEMTRCEMFRDAIVKHIEDRGFMETEDLEEAFEKIDSSDHVMGLWRREREPFIWSADYPKIWQVVVSFADQKEAEEFLAKMKAAWVKRRSSEDVRNA